MAKSIVHLTPVSNVMDSKLIDNTNVIQREFDSYKDAFTFTNINTGHERVDTLINVSLYDDVMTYNDKNYRILHMKTIG